MTHNFRQLKRIRSKVKSPIYIHFQETLHGQTSIRAFDKADEFRLKNQLLLDNFNRVRYAQRMSTEWLTLRIGLMNSIAILAASLFAVFARDMDGASGSIGICIIYTDTFTGMLGWLIHVTAQVEANVVSVERVQAYIDDLKQEPPKQLETDKSIDSNWPQNGGIVFKGYSARYRDNLPLVINELSIDIKGGSKVGICGRTGAGKSSLTVALFRLIENNENNGYISIDGHKITDLGLHKLRSALGNDLSIAEVDRKFHINHYQL